MLKWFDLGLGFLIGLICLTIAVVTLWIML